MSEKKWIKKACSIDVGKILVFGLLILLISGSAASAADTGWVVPSSNTGGSGVTNPQNAYASDTVNARFAANGNYWNWYGYVLSSIPSGSTIDGIEVNARGLRQSGCSTNCLMRLRLSYDSGTSWTSYINTATWTTTETDHILGGPTNTWGRSWTRDEIVNSFRIQALWQVASGTYYGDLDYLPVRVYYTAGAASTYNISGYITNASSGLPLNGATVQTNTTLSTTTNAQGYYIFTGLSNGSYNITATQTNYNSNYTIKTINGAHITNANILLTPIPPAPTYLLSGHVTNQSNGAAISGATVTTNTSLTTSTDGTGYYSFTVSNGNYLITASKTGYNSNSITKTVNGAAVSNADISLTAIPPSTGGKIFVATNRYVILDDPISTGKTAQTAASFALPWSGSSNWGRNDWTTAQTTIKGYALVLSTEGSPVVNTPVIFTVRNWDSLDKTTSTAINTDANGIASYSLDLNAKNYYGNWYVDANATAIGKTDTTGFIYNWWGCNAGGCRNHGSDSPGTATPSRQNSPYTLGRETITANGNHASITDTGCVGCHRSYGGTGGGAQFTGQPTKTADVHVTDTCATCHATIATHDTNEPIKSCTDCHSWANLSQENTMSSGTTPMSNYSGTVAATGHNPNSTILCIICHGPMHNTTKPDETLRMTRNNVVEDSQCLTCHTSFEKHNGGVGCTLCHSQDAHAIQVFSQTAGYVNKGNAYQGDCTNCHQNATFVNALINAPKAGSYSGSAPQVQKPLNHSTDRNGTKWGTYWTSTKDACVYCHGDNKHIAARLGNAAAAVGTDTIGGAIGTGTVCSSCHDSNDNDYLAAMALLVPDPVANQPGTNWNVTGTDHASYGTTDADCMTCHGGVLSASPDISEFVHNVDAGKSGGPNCISCHDIAGTAPKHIDVNVLKNSSHKNLNGALTDTNKACYACHSDGTAPSSGHPLNYKNPKVCADCHTGSGNYSAPLVIEHKQNGQDVNISATCDSCHDNNGMFLSNAGTNGMTSAFGHYIKDITNRSTNPYQHFGPINTSNCNLCHNGAYTNNASWGTPVNISTSTKRAHSETLTSQCDGCHNDGAVPSLANVDFHNASIKLADATDCISCHTSATGPGGIYAAINTATFTQHKNVNNTDGGLTNSDCKVCHTDISNMMTSGFTTATRACSECHTGTGVPNAVIIDNHRQNGVNISTVSSCANCHNNSVNSGFAYSENATVGHYATKTGLIGTQDCTNCHKDSVNGTKWGSALDPANSGTFPHSITNTPKEDCYVCHNSAVNFHNKTLVKPSVSTVNCLDCHKTTATMAPKKIDASVIASGSHNSQACENCHAGATDTNMNSYSFTSDPAKTCIACHTGAGQFNAPLVAEHNQNGQDITTLASCATCHSNGGMFLTNTGTNGSSSAITHYIKDVTNMASLPYQHSGTINTSNCILCHNGAYTNNASWGTPVNISTSSKRAHSETLTSQCDGCHKDSTVSSLTQVDFHNASLQGSDINNCLNCHTSATGPGGIYAAINTASFTQHKNVNNTDGGLTNSDCKVCHTDISNMMTSGFTTATKVCADCHTSGNYNAPIISNHNQNGVNISTPAYCSSCHNNSVAQYIYSKNASVGHYGTKTNLIATADCTDCHKNPVNASIWGQASDPANSGTFPHSIANTPKEDCYACHNSASDFHNVSLAKPAIGTVTCLDCHKTTATMAPKKIDASVIASGSHNSQACENCHAGATDTNMNSYSFTSDPAKTCTACHTGAGQFNAPLVAEHNQNGQDITTLASCATCHSNGGMYLTNTGTNGSSSAITHYIKDVTNMASLPYQHSGTINTSNCILCHNGAYTNNASWGTPVNISTSTKRAHSETQTSQCDQCHKDSTVSSLTQVDFHNASLQGSDINNCLNCHTSATGPGGIYAGINTATFTQHKNVNNTDGGLTNSDCKVCHTDISNMMTSGFTTATKACSECHTGTGVPNAVIVDNHRQNGVNISTVSSCANCHNNSVNSGFAYSENATVGHYATKTGLIGTQDCTNCHKDSVNGTKWGSALDPANSGTFPHSITNTPKEDCYVCHNSAVNFHNKTLVKPSVSTVNCLDCHKTTATMAPKKIDASVIASGSHNSQACENCHAGATDTNMNSYSFTSDPAKTCTACHTGAGQFNAPLVAEHNQNGQDITTLASCATCHSNGGMFLTNTGTNGSSSAITHYIKDVTNMASLPYQHSGTINTSNCILCHNGAYTNNASWGTPVNISTSIKRAHSETLTSQCDQCHKDSTVSSLTQVDFHNASLQGSDINNCLNCHTSATGPGGIYAAINTATFTQHKNVNNTDGGLTNSDCKVCHTDISNMMTSGFTTATKACSECHTGTGVPNAVIVDNHRQSGVNISTVSSCANCHNNSVNSGFAYSENATVGHYATKTGLIGTQDCTNCHKDSVNGTKWGSALDPANSGTFPHSITNTPKEDCYVCHNSAVNFHNKTLVKPSVSTVNCLDCHKTTATMAPKKIDASVIVSGSHNSQACENCHAGATDTNMNSYSFTSDPAKTCTACHTGAGQFNAPLVAEHNQNGQDITTLASCATCHSNGGMFLTNTGTNGSSSAITHYIKDVTNMASLPYQHSGTINTSNCILCHNGAYTNNASWGTPVNISTSSKRAHSETLTSQCDICHNEGTVSSLAQVDFHNSSLRISDINNCLGCHTTVTSPDLGNHSRLNGTSAVENGDCKTCHYGPFPMVKGAVNNSNTYFCADCHTVGGSGTNISSIKFTDKKHGEVTCINCHVADGIYHQGDPRGSVSNATYASRDTTNTYTSTRTECGDCHSKSNLDDAPFNAPGGGSHANGACASGGCHGPSGAVVQVVHNVNPLDAVTKKPYISTPTLDHSTVAQGTDVNITVTVNFTTNYGNALVDGAQYRINNSDNSQTIQSWTPMIASDGNFNTILEVATGRINTSTLSGTYNIEVKGMGGGPSQNPLERYYPMNGDVSASQVIPLTVEAPQGYINGTVKSNGVNLSGVIVSTSGASDVTEPDGTYSLKVPEGTYNVIASKQPTHNDNTITGIVVTPGNATIVDITLAQKPTGTISGTVTNV